MKQPILVLLLVGILSHPAPSTSVRNQLEPALGDAMGALGRVLDYCEHNYRMLNLDAVIGIRMVDGQLTVLLRRLRAGRVHAEPEQIGRIASLQERTASLADRTLPELERQDKDYFRRLSPIVQPGFWQSDVTSKTTDSALLSPPSVPRDHPFDEEDSDKCLSELLGTGQTGGKRCQISDECWETLTAARYTGYWLTHELFYLEVGERAGCLDDLEVRAAESGKRGGVLGMKAKYCANILREARKIAGDGFIEGGQDLFMEQALLCGLVGYRDFFRSSWLSAILKWQSPSGCFGEFTTPSTGWIAGRHKRVRRRERKITDGCLMHKTGVAAGNLAGYLRFILEYYQDLAEGRLRL